MSSHLGIGKLSLGVYQSGLCLEVCTCLPFCLKFSGVAAALAPCTTIDLAEPGETADDLVEKVHGLGFRVHLGGGFFQQVLQFGGVVASETFAMP